MTEVVARLCLGIAAMVAVPLIVALVRDFSRSRRKAKLDALDASLDAQDGCAACGERDVAWVGEGVYVCPACGYEGGEGFAAHEAAQRRKKLSALPEEKREKAAARIRSDAKLLLTGVQQDLERQSRSLARDVQHARQDESHGWLDELLGLVQRAREGLVAVQDVAILEGSDFDIPTEMDQVDPRMWWSNELGAEIDAVCVRQDLARVAQSVERGLARLDRS